MTVNRKNWPKQTWQYPLPHDFNFGFGLDIDDTVTTKHATIMPYLMQDNAIIDYEAIKTNPENADFAAVSKPNVAAGSFVPKIMVTWYAWSRPVEIDHLRFYTMGIHTAFLNRLDAFDKKTGEDTETLLELTHETTDEQAYPLWNTVKIYEGHGVLDLPAEVPGLTANQQNEGVDFDIEKYFDARQYYTNKRMLDSMTEPMKSYDIDGISKAVPLGNRLKRRFQVIRNPICKFQNPYTFCGELFCSPVAGSVHQTHLAADTTAVEHLTIVGRVRFNEYNPDWNFARA